MINAQQELKSHRDYMQRMLSSMSIRDADRYPSYIKALYATEAFLVEKAREQLEYAEVEYGDEKSPALTGLPYPRLLPA